MSEDIVCDLYDENDPPLKSGPWYSFGLPVKVEAGESVEIIIPLPESREP